MFIGAVPDALLSQMLTSIDFKEWPSAHIICSGSFKIERALRVVSPHTKVYGNDVSLLSCCLGALGSGGDLDFTFTGALQWIEELIGPDLHQRTAALLIAMDLAPFLTGGTSIYKTRHLDHYRRAFSDLLVLAEAKLETLRKQLVLDGFLAGDFLEQIEAAKAAGSGIIGFPPTYRGGYEAMFKFIDANTEWNRPSYALFDPASLGGVVDGIEAAGLPFCILTDQRLEGRSPGIELRPGRKHPIYGYASSGRASFMRSGQLHPTPFPYRSLDLGALAADSAIALTICDAGKAAFVKDVYLAKHIQHTNGEVNVLVYLDGMLAGLIVFARSRVQVYHGNEIYLLSDLSTTREAKISKLIARLSTCAEIVRELEHHYLRRFEYVVTTAFAKGPVSMKYRGVFELLKRQETPDGFMLNYGRATGGETASEAYRWWWDKHGESETRSARSA